MTTEQIAAKPQFSTQSGGSTTGTLTSAAETASLAADDEESEEARCERETGPQKSETAKTIWGDLASQPIAKSTRADANLESNSRNREPRRELLRQNRSQPKDSANRGDKVNCVPVSSHQPSTQRKLHNDRILLAPTPTSVANPEIPHAVLQCEEAHPAGLPKQQTSLRSRPTVGTHNHRPARHAWDNRHGNCATNRITKRPRASQLSNDDPRSPQPYPTEAGQ